MASWKRVITTADDANYQNEDITLGQLHKGIGAGTGNAAGRVLKLNSNNDGIEWATETDTVYSLPTATATVLGGVKVGSNLSILNGVLSATNSNTTYTLAANDNSPAANIVFTPSSGSATTIELTDGDLTYAVSGNNITASISAERVQDIVGAMFTGNTETRVSATYQDGDGTIDLVADNMNYSLPTATSTTKGGIKVGSGLAILNEVLSCTVQNTDTDVSVANLKTRLAGGFSSNAVTIGDSDDVVTIGNDLVVTGDLTINGDTTTVNTGQLHVEDKLIKLANVDSPTTTTGNGAGVQVEVSASETEFPELKWDKDGKLTGWTLSDYKSSSNEDVPVAVMKFGTAAPSGNPDAGQGTLFADATNEKLYVYI